MYLIFLLTGGDFLVQGTQLPLIIHTLMNITVTWFYFLIQCKSFFFFCLICWFWIYMEHENWLVLVLILLTSRLSYIFVFVVEGMCIDSPFESTAIEILKGFREQLMWKLESFLFVWESTKSKFFVALMRAPFKL